LHAAALENRIELAAMLLLHFADVNSVTDRWQPLPPRAFSLFCCYFLPQPFTTPLLLLTLKYQCFPRCSGLTPTDFAVEKQMEEGDNIMRTEMVTLLRKHGVRLL